METVAIIGAGDIGATTACALATLQCAREIRLIDPNGAVAAGKALDIQQAGSIDGSDVRLSGSVDVATAIGAAVVVVADPAGGDGDWRDEAALELVRRLAELAPAAPLVCAGAGQRGLLARAHRELRVTRQCLIGSAPGALVSAARAMVAIGAHCSADDVALAVVGVPGSWVFAWNECTVAGSPIVTSLPPHVVAQIDRHAQASWPPGPYALGSAAARTVAGILGCSRRRFTVFAILDGEYDVRSIAAALPATLGPAGIRELLPPALSIRERVTLDTALARG
jgi:malate/lactate dehydrogenase